MFESKRRPIVVPQAEHLKLSGQMAFHWGAAGFSLPIARDSFVLGVATHDRAFGYLDTAAVGKIAPAARAAQVDAWLASAGTDLEAELVVLFHVRRLMQMPRPGPLSARLDQRIAAVAAGRDLSAFHRADTITAFCDVVSFDICFEAEVSRSLTVATDDGAVDLQYALQGGVAVVRPWPFTCPKLEGYLLAYRSAGYPEALDPLLLSYSIRPG
ncbi:MAG: DUF3891 family protein [Pseudomonadota bacterium]